MAGNTWQQINSQKSFSQPCRLLACLKRCSLHLIQQSILFRIVEQRRRQTCSQNYISDWLETLLPPSHPIINIVQDCRTKAEARLKHSNGLFCAEFLDTVLPGGGTYRYQRGTAWYNQRVAYDPTLPGAS
eukprot:scaffold5856_cov109-Cylindrotheca_fusiformis.AAC.1